MRYSPVFVGGQSDRGRPLGGAKLCQDSFKAISAITDRFAALFPAGESLRRGRGFFVLGLHVLKRAGESDLFRVDNQSARFPRALTQGGRLSVALFFFGGGARPHDPRGGQFDILCMHDTTSGRLNFAQRAMGSPVLPDGSGWRGRNDAPGFSAIHVRDFENEMAQHFRGALCPVPSAKHVLPVPGRRPWGPVLLVGSADCDGTRFRANCRT